MHAISQKLSPGVVAVDVHGDIDVYTAPELKERLFTCLDEGAERLLIDLRHCEVLDSTGLGVLVATIKHARGREVAIVSPNGNLRRILEIVGLDRILPVYHSRSEALGQPVA